jgi:hypothetical protein
MAFINSKRFQSDIELGKRYNDPQTGINGVATSIHFYQYACERVTLEFVKPDGELQEVTFDSPRLEDAETKERATTTRTGGPGDGIGQKSSQAQAPAR